MRVEDLEKEYGNLAKIFQANYLLINQHSASFLNQALNHVADLDPSASHENDLTEPIAKLDKKIVKFLNGLITKLNRNDGETLFDFCFDSLFSESSRTLSVHGYKIIIQLLVKHLPNLVAINNLNRVILSLFLHTYLKNGHLTKLSFEI